MTHTGIQEWPFELATMWFKVIDWWISDLAYNIIDRP